MAKIKKNIKTAQLIEENKFTVFLMLSAFLVTVFVFSTYNIEDDDFYWHLTTGKYIIENKVIPDKDVLSYVTENTKWIPFEWGWDVLIYFIYSISSINMVSIFSALIFCLIF